MMEPSIYVGICSEGRQLFWLELTLILTGWTLPDCWSSLGFEPKITTIDVFWFTSWSIPALFIGKRSVTFTFLNYSISDSSGTNHKTVGCQKTVPITNQFLTCSEIPWPRGLESQHQFQGTGLVRTVVSISHCGCDDPGSIPGLDISLFLIIIPIPNGNGKSSFFGRAWRWRLTMACHQSFYRFWHGVHLNWPTYSVPEKLTKFSTFGAPENLTRKH